MLKTFCVVGDSWQDASAGNGRRLVRVTSFDGSQYTVTGMLPPSKGGPGAGSLGTLFFLPGAGEYAHVVTFMGFEALEGDARQAVFAQAQEAPALAARPRQVAVLSPEDAQAQAQERAARRLANNQRVAASLDAASEVAPA